MVDNNNTLFLKKALLHILLLGTMQACAGAKPVRQTVADTTIKNNTDSFVFIKKIPGQFTGMQVDIANNIYVITASNQLKKYSAALDSMAVFNDVKKYGYPSQIDVTNPLRTLLYYKNFSSIVLLDRLLSPRNTINLRQQNIFGVSAIANAYDNNIWLFDEQEFKLRKIDETGRSIMETTDWRTLLNDAPTPQTIIDNNNFVYLYDAQRGFYLFDYYGTYKTYLPFKGWKNITVNKGRLMGIATNTLYVYDVATMVEKKYSLPEIFKTATDAKAINGLLYLLKPDGLELYQFL